MENTTTTYDYSDLQQDVNELSRYNRKFIRYQSARQQWRDRFIEYESLLFNDIEGTGTQLTKAQLLELEQKYAIPITANVLVAIVEQLLSFLTLNDPTVTVTPVGDSSKHFAYVWRELGLATLQLNKFKKHQKRVTRDCLTGGHGVFQVKPNNFYSFNEFNTVVKRIRWEYVYIDDTSEDDDFQDSEMMFVAKRILKKKAQKDYKLTNKQISFASQTLSVDSWAPTQSKVNLNSGLDTEETLIWIQEIYEKVPATVYIMPDGTPTTKQPEQPYIDTNGQLVTPPQAIAQYQRVCVKKCIKVGNLLVHKEIMPISKYPFIFYVHTHKDDPYTYGVVHMVADCCYALNKALALTLENAQKGSNYGTMSPSGSIVNKDEWEKQGATPGGNQEYIPDPSLPNGGAPVIKQPLPLSNAWFTFFQQMIKLIEYITGIFDLMQGNGANAPQTLGATTSLQNFGTQRVKSLAENFDIANEQLMELIIEFIQAYAPKGNIMHYLYDTDAYRTIRTDVEGAIMKNAEGTERFQEQAGGKQMATLIEDSVTNRITAIVGQVKLGQYKVHYNSANNLPSTRNAALQIITQALAHVGNEQLAIALMKQALKLADMPQVDEALKEADVLTQQQQQIAQMSQEIEQMIKENEQLKSKLENSIMREKVAEIEAKIAGAEGAMKEKIKNFDKSAQEYKSEQKRKERVTNYA